jgi:uncharacterized protein YlxW (UPF0749 family)
MPAFLIPHLIILLLGFSGGFALSHKLDQLQYDDLKAAVERANSEASTQLAKAQQAAQSAEQKAYEFNRQLDQSHDSFINTTNALHDRLATVRLRDPGSRQSCNNAVPATANSSQPETEAVDNAELSDELDQFIKSEAYRADQVAAYAETCYQFIKGQGSGHAAIH